MHNVLRQFIGGGAINQQNVVQNQAQPNHGGLGGNQIDPERGDQSPALFPDTYRGRQWERNQFLWDQRRAAAIRQMHIDHRNQQKERGRIPVQNINVDRLPAQAVSQQAIDNEQGGVVQADVPEHGALQENQTWLDHANDAAGHFNDQVDAVQSFFLGGFFRAVGEVAVGLGRELRPGAIRRAIREFAQLP